MKLVIDIPEDMYNDANILIVEDLPELKKIISNGTPLPKGHGRLIILSEDILKENQINLDFSYQKWISEVGLSLATVAVIDADKETKK